MLNIVIKGMTCKDGKYRVFSYIPRRNEAPIFLEISQSELMMMLLSRCGDGFGFETPEDLYQAVNKHEAFSAEITLK